MTQDSRDQRLDVVGKHEVPAREVGPCLGRAIESHARSGAAAQAQLGPLARRPDEVDDVVLDRGADGDGSDGFAHREQLIGRGDRGHGVQRLGAVPIAPGDAAFVGATRVAKPDPDEEAVQLRLRQGERPLQLDGVLGRQHEEWVRQVARDALDRDVPFLHRLQEGRLRARRRPVDLVHEQDVGEDRSGDEAKRATLEHARAEDVAREQVRRALDAREVQAERAAERPRQQRLPDAGDVLDQDVATCQQGDQQEADGLFLDDDRLPDRVADRAPEVLTRERTRRGARRCHRLGLLGRTTTGSLWPSLSREWAVDAAGGPQVRRRESYPPRARARRCRAGPGDRCPSRPRDRAPTTRRSRRR